jgi:UMF1 family MFS transporter
VSALGTGLGYAGVPVSLWLGLVVSKTSIGVPGSFLVASAMFLLGTVPLWLFVRDAPVAADRPLPAADDGILAAFRRIAADRRLLLLLAANFVCADVANTLIQWATLYFTKSAGLSDDAAVYMVMALSVTAFAGGLAIGRVADRVAPTLLYLGCCLGLLAGLLGAALAPGRGWASALLVLTGGLGVSGIWSVGRQLVFVLSPPERYGEALGLYGVTVKMSIVGTAVFGVVVDAVADPAWKYPAAILVEAACLAVGCLMIWALHREIGKRASARTAGA